jgi:hypothetical protein
VILAALLSYLALSGIEVFLKYSESISVSENIELEVRCNIFELLETDA